MASRSTKTRSAIRWTCLPTTSIRKAHLQGDRGHARQQGCRGGRPNGNNVLYTPDPNFIGIDQFTYTITDTDGSMDTATVTVDVPNLGEPPLAKNDAATVLERQPAERHPRAGQRQSGREPGRLDDHRRSRRARTARFDSSGRAGRDLPAEPELLRHRHVHLHDQRQQGRHEHRAT